MKFTLFTIALFALIISLSSCTADEIEIKKPVNEDVFKQAVDSLDYSTSTEVDPPLIIPPKQ
jgi:hypothetical protein